MTMLNEMGQNQGEGGTTKMPKRSADKADAGDAIEKVKAAAGDKLDNEEDLGGPVVKGDEDTGPFKAADKTPGKKKRPADKDNADALKDVSSSKLLTKAYESLTALDKNTIRERYAAIDAAINGVSLDPDDVDLSEEVNVLLGSEKDLSEAFKKKATTILETRFNQMVRDEKSRLNDLYESQLNEEVESVRSDLTEKLDSYLDYASEEWFNENRIAVESGIRNEISESFMTGLYKLLEDHSMNLPEDQVDVLEQVASQKKELETRFNKTVSESLVMKKQLTSLIKEKVLNTVCDGLADTEKEKISDLVENVDFVSTDELTDKIKTLREHYYPTNNNSDANDSNVLSEEMLSSKEQELREENAKKPQAVLSDDPAVNALAEQVNRLAQH